jgi:hypothetical protein
VNKVKPTMAECVRGPLDGTEFACDGLIPDKVYVLWTAPTGGTDRKFNYQFTHCLNRPRFFFLGYTRK